MGVKLSVLMRLMEQMCEERGVDRKNKNQFQVMGDLGMWCDTKDEIRELLALEFHRRVAAKMPTAPFKFKQKKIRKSPKAGYKAICSSYKGSGGLRTGNGYKMPNKPSGFTKDFYNTREWRSIRFIALRESKGCCCLCGRTNREHGVVLHVDHIKPKSLYPKLALVLSNLQVLCEDCNLGKGNMDETDWRPTSPNSQNVIPFKVTP